MAHRVTFTLPDRELHRADIEFVIKTDGETLGRLLVSKGGVEWRARNKQHGKKTSWKKLDALMG